MLLSYESRTTDSWRFWLILSAVFLGLSFIISYFGLFGSWTVSAFGVPYYYNWDPDGFYLGSGITFFDQRYVGFVGHPGITLMFLIQIIARGGYFFTSLSKNSPSFEAFTAKNIFWIILATKLAITGIHLLSFYVLYRVSLIFLDKTAARIAVLAYATTAIILYYINKISPEPLMVLFTLLALLGIRRYLEHHNQHLGVLYLSLSAFATSAALVTKILIVAPLLLFIPIYIAGQKSLPWRNRLASLSLFLFLCGIFLLLFGWKVDWKYFYRFWTDYAPKFYFPYIQYKHWFPNFVQKASIISGNFFIQLSKMMFSSFWPLGISSQKIQFHLAEVGFVIFSVAGMVIYWKREPAKRKQVAWLGLFILMMAPVVLYKSAHHYFVIHFALSSIFFSYFICRMADRGKKKNKFLVACLTTILFIHSFSIAIFVETKKSDIIGYTQRWKPYYRALNEIGYNERIGLVNIPYHSDIPGRLISYYTPPSSPFSREFNRFFVVTDDWTTEKELADKNIKVTLEWTPRGIITKHIR